jgi:hypothetical protein
MKISSYERITTINPDPAKKGVRIEKSKYAAIRPIILEFLRNEDRATFSQIAEEVRRQLTVQFEGSIDWYTISVKLDMEARGEIIRVREKNRDYMMLAGN